MKNHKGRLQDWYQKHHLPIPVYSYHYALSEWVTVVTTVNGRFTAKAASKKEAASAAAQQALLKLPRRRNRKPPSRAANRHPPLQQKQQQQKQEQQHQRYTARLCTLVLVDLENYPQIDGDFLTTQFINVTIMGFVGKCSSLAQVDLRLRYPFMSSIIIVDSVLPDAVDHYISLYAGSCIHHTYALLILTRDRFAGCVVDSVKQLFGDVHVIHVTNSARCYEELIKLC